MAVVVPRRQSAVQKALAQAMTKAVISEDFEALKRHVEADVDLELSEGSGWTPLILAAWYGQLEMLKLLIDAGASVKAADRNGWNAYHHACYGGHADCVELLLEHDVDVAAVQSDGKTGRDMAISEKHEKLVELLVEHGVPERDKPPEPPEGSNGTARAPKKRRRAEEEGRKGPKRALSAYMFFAQDRRAALLQDRPELRCAALCLPLRLLCDLSNSRAFVKTVQWICHGHRQGLGRALAGCNVGRESSVCSPGRERQGSLSA